VAATTDDVRGLCLAFAIGAAIIAIFLGDALATGMSALLFVFHAHPLALYLPNSGVAILISAVVAAVVGTGPAAGNPVAPLIVVTVGITVSSTVVAESITVAGIKATVVAAAVKSTAAIVASADALVKATRAARKTLSAA
jgi:hypothetical protein